MSNEINKLKRYWDGDQWREREIKSNPEVSLCLLHDYPVVKQSDFAYKGCWGCQHFDGLNENYCFVREAAEQLRKSPRTIARWCKSGRLAGAILNRKTRKRRNDGLWRHAPKVWLIPRSSVNCIIACDMFAQKHCVPPTLIEAATRSEDWAMVLNQMMKNAGL